MKIIRKMYEEAEAVLRKAQKKIKWQVYKGGREVE